MVYGETDIKTDGLMNRRSTSVSSRAAQDSLNLATRYNLNSNPVVEYGEQVLKRIFASMYPLVY
jgi:hypothetical protein